MALITRPADSIKISIIDYLLENYPGVIIGNEVMYGTTRKIVDLLALYEGNTYAIEIKSEKDNTRRLPEQLKQYGLIFDYTIVFAHSKHLPEVLAVAQPRVSVYEVEGRDIRKVRCSNKRNRPTKYEMVHSIPSSFLKKYLYALQENDSDFIRRQIIKTYRYEEIQKMFYLFLERKLTERFKLFLRERAEKNSLDDLSLLSAWLNL